MIFNCFGNIRFGSSTGITLGEIYDENGLTVRNFKFYGRKK